jgi:hypothetical protein
MVQNKRNRRMGIAVAAALLLATTAVQADVITGAGAGAGPDRKVKSGAKGAQKGGVNVAAGDVNGDGRAEAPKRPVTPITPIAKPATPKPLPPGPVNVQAPPKKPEPLLVPAVQKIREAAPRAK